jgi:diphosphomevalonate decarboxylase
MRATALAHPNVALAKYWGKRPVAGNVPATPSVSITMGGLHTRTTVEWREGSGVDEISINGAPQTGAAATKAIALLDEVRGLARRTMHARVESTNDFPTASGLASSASGFAALALAATAAAGLTLDRGALSRMARRGSASAARSIFGGYVTLGTEDDAGARELAPPTHWPLSIVIGAATEAAKSTGSTDGMRHTAETSPYFGAWLEDAPKLAKAIAEAIVRRDLAAVGEAAEASALRMHASMWAARPALTYWGPTTLAMLEAVRSLRKSGVGAWATSDAGPHVKVICAPSDEDAVASALSGVAARVLRAHVGEAAALIASTKIDGGQTR